MAVQSPDELVEAEHPVRVIWRVVCGLDLGRFYDPIRARAGGAGRDSTDPRHASMDERLIANPFIVSLMSASGR